MTKINGDKPLFQYSHFCPIFSYCFCHSFCTASAQDPLLPPHHPPISSHCGTHPLLCSQPPSPSQLPVLGRASWLEEGQGGQAQSQLQDLWQTAGKGWGTCWEQLLAWLCRAAGRGCSCLSALGLKTKPCSKESRAPEQPAFPTTACWHCQGTPSAPTGVG